MSEKDFVDALRDRRIRDGNRFDELRHLTAAQETDEADRLEELRLAARRAPSRFDSLQTDIRESLARFPDSPLIRLQEAWFLYDWGDMGADVHASGSRARLEESSQAFGSVRDRLSPEWVESCWLGELQCLRRLAKYGDAETLSKHAITACPASTKIFNEMGWIAVEQQDYETALGYFKQSPDDEVACEGVAQSLRKSRNFACCESYIKEKCAASQPDNVRILKEHGWLAIEQRDYLSALHRFESALRVKPADEVALEGRLQSLRGLRQFKVAEDFARVVLEDNETHPRIREEIGWRLWDAKQYEEALRHFESQPDHEASYEGRALCCRFLRRFKEAETTLQIGLDRFPGSARLSNQRGWLYFDQLDYQRALEEFEKVLASSGKYGDETAFHGNRLPATYA